MSWGKHMLCPICHKEFNYKPEQSLRNKQLYICNSCMIREVLGFIPDSKVPQQAKKAIFVLCKALAEQSENQLQHIEKQLEHTEKQPEHKEMVDVFQHKGENK